jgi:hypothetical protein
VRSQIVDFPIFELIIVALILSAITAFSIDAMRRRDLDRQWQTKVVIANAKKADELEKFFEKWKQTGVLKDGTVEQWSGANSEVLFIERSSQCTLHDDRYWMLCWTIWARTSETHRYFTVSVRIDVDDGSRLVSEQWHSDVDVHHVIERALSLGKENAVKKVGVARNEA